MRWHPRVHHVKVTKAKLGKHTAMVKHIIKEAHRLGTVHKTKNPRRRFVPRVHKTALRNFWGGSPTASRAAVHRKSDKPKKPHKAHTARSYRKPRTHR